MTTAYFTIASANYLAYVRTLHASLIAAQPDAVFYLFLVDEVRDSQIAEAMPFPVVEARDVAIPCFFDMAYRYSIMELNTAIKPFCIEHLMDAHGHDRVVYLDPDIFVVNALTSVQAAFDEGAELVLTPHALAPLNDGRHPDDRAIMQTGAYNLGFGAFSNAPEVRQLLRWWAEHLRTRCVVDLANGLFVDQKFMDYAPALVGATKILRDPGYNAAYWNLHERNIVYTEQKGWQANDFPLAFFHFSGVDPKDPSVFSRHQNRHTIKTIGPLADLHRTYLGQLAANATLGADSVDHLRYAYGHHTDGTPILEAMRFVYRRVFPEPQDHSFEEIFTFHPGLFNTISEDWREEDDRITRLMQQVWSMRSDLKAHFDLMRKGDRSAYIDWFVRQAPQEHSLPPSLYEFLPCSDKPDDIRSGAAGPVDHARNESVELYGYLKTESGVGEGARGLLQALKTAGVATHTVTLEPPDFDNTVSIEKVVDEDGQNSHRVAILHVNADRTTELVNAHCPSLEGQYRIGYWAWELPQFPSAWLPATDCVHEIWCPSRFVASSIKHVTSKPVRVVPHAVEAGGGSGARARQSLGVDETTKVILTTFDTRSYLARKNPHAALRAFQSAFPSPQRANTILIMKSHGPVHTEEAKRFFSEVASAEGVVSLHSVMAPTELDDLYTAADVFLSLHRSEGFGLSLARSMAEGKPVVATNWSGNVDFMSGENSVLIDYTLSDVPEGNYPYAEGQHWAQPNIEHAAEKLHWLMAKKERREQLGQAAAQSAVQQLSPSRVGWMARQRLGEVFSATSGS